MSMLNYSGSLQRNWMLYEVEQFIQQVPQVTHDTRRYSYISTEKNLKLDHGHQVNHQPCFLPFTLKWGKNGFIGVSVNTFYYISFSLVMPGGNILFLKNPLLEQSNTEKVVWYYILATSEI